MKGTLWYQKATYTNIFKVKTQNRVKFETTAETNNKSISRQTSMVFDYLHQSFWFRLFLFIFTFYFVLVFPAISDFFSNIFFQKIPKLFPIFGGKLKLDKNQGAFSTFSSTNVF